MTEASARFALPFLQPGQAQKELFHNEALAAIDLVLHPAVQATGANTPPAEPQPGQCWIVGTSPTGEWTGHAGSITGWTGGGWRFVTPVEGMFVWVVADGVWAHRANGGWQLGVLAATSISVGGEQVVGGRQPAIAGPTGGVTVDAEARAAIAAVLGALRSHGLIAA